jgi:hypothetical protein
VTQPYCCVTERLVYASMHCVFVALRPPWLQRVVVLVYNSGCDTQLRMRGKFLFFSK